MGSMLSATELAEMLDLSKGRISQLVAEGKLDACYIGSGRARRFDPVAVARALGKRIDPAQKLGNGAPTQAAAARILQDQAPPRSAPPTTPGDDYEQARTVKAQEEARRLRRLNLEAEGAFVLAEEAARQARRQIGQEIAEVQTFIRDTARVIADRHGVDFKTVRQDMLDQWRAHRGRRAEEAEERAASAEMAAAELEQDI